MHPVGLREAPLAEGPPRGQAVGMKLDCDQETLRQGWPAGLELSVLHSGIDEVLVLESAFWTAPLSGEHRWAKEALGSLRYEAGEDHYVLNTTAGLWAPLLLQTGVLLPGSRARTLVGTSCLEEGTHQAELVVSGWSFPLDELEERAYQLDPASASRPTQRFRRGPAEEGRVRDAWVHLAGASRRSERLSLTFEVQPDADNPAQAALDSVRGGQIVARLRRGGGAWVLVDSAGQLHLIRGQERIQLPSPILDLDTLRALDREPPFVPLDLVFQGDDALGWRDRLELPLGGAELGQQRLESANLWSFLEAAGRAGRTLRWGRHATIASGLVVS